MSIPFIDLYNDEGMVRGHKAAVIVQEKPGLSRKIAMVVVKPGGNALAGLSREVDILVNEILLKTRVSVKTCVSDSKGKGRALTILWKSNGRPRSTISGGLGIFDSMRGGFGLLSLQMR